MIKNSLLIATLLSAVASGVAAQSVSTTESNGFAFCGDRPSEPESIADIPMRESHKRILVQRMYTVNALTSVVEAEDCSCEIRFPSWDTTVEQYLEMYAGIDDRHEILALTSEFRRTTNDLRKLARPTCIEVGNW